MSQRTVVTVQPGFDNTFLFWLESPSTIQDAAKPEVFACRPEDLPPWSQPQAVQTHGQKILSALRQHPAVAEALQLATQHNPHEPHPLYFHLKVEEAEQLSWETLCDEKGRFLALSVRWPIARIAQSDLPTTIRSFTSPLRIMALLSAAGVKAAREWRALRKAVAEARAAGLAIHLRVYVGEKTLLDTINQEIQDGLADVEVFSTPADVDNLQDELAATQPHILHFFCHGITDFGIPQLELATLLDWQRGAPRGSLQIDLEDMATWPELSPIWLVTLNCCKSGQGDSEQHSMAYQLVSHGVPAAVGMLEPIDALDAHAFCGRFYPAIFEKLVKVEEKLAAQPGEGTAGIEWAEALWAARVALAQRANRKRSHDREWTLPLLYVQREPFMVQKRHLLDAAQLDKLREVTGILRSLPQDTPASVRERILAMLGGDFPAELRPDPFGRVFGEAA